MELIEKILIAIDRESKKGEIYSDAMDCLKNMGEDGLTFNTQLRQRAATAMGQAIQDKDFNLAEKLYNVHRDTYFFGANWVFEDFIIGMEYSRSNEKQFYLPRKEQLSKVAREMQRLADGELDLLCISLPPGTGKTTLAIFFILWLTGRNPEEAILTGSHSTSIMSGVYEECVRMATTDEYNFSKIFPQSQLVNTNAKDLLLNFGKRKRFASLQFTSIGSANAGKFRAMQLLYCDDLVSSLEQSLSAERMDKLWQAYTVDLKQRKQGTCAELHIATRWQPRDIIGRLELENDKNNRAKFVVVPALDEAGDSNFDYKYELGFSTKNYIDLRNSMDDASWRALYMNEPIYREGLVLPADELNYFYELPLDRDPDTIFCCLDTAESGKDYTAMVIGAIYGESTYIIDVVYDNSPPDVTKPQCAKKIYENKVLAGTAESNNSGGYYIRDVIDILNSQYGYKINMRTKYSVTRKETRIEMASDGIKKRFYFKDPSTYDQRSQYGQFFKAITSYTRTGRNRTDDAIDALSLMENELRVLHSYKVEVISRPF